ncbi:Sialate O-acetylesterase [Pirellula staleyi DSM 6068]|uniref:Sialate O-acetylesterase n=1 Tax=Pirellula staleyi (strain ATCC 27377 / DSM 6068 / ICPB 4128) TaxID=530564 RepID=D2QX68_PIRSD|nr:sialate O-acetylesterase [Pirellula staleyi]ADB17908.1 Sialate O-acetylesterase [Pirellula staleyi DSM 6068]
MKLRFRSFLLAIAAALAAASNLQAEVALPKVFGDHMVLQQSSEVAIWGTGAVGEEVTITLGDATAKAATGENGKWMAKLKTPAGSKEARELVVKGTNEVRFKDVLVGEVWICSGQSNMEWSVAASDNPQKEAEAANFPLIRMIKVEKAVAGEPQTDIKGAWQVCSPSTVPGFSAVGYFFGRKLHQDLDVPVGMINTSWGGTICEAWTSKEALAASEPLKFMTERQLNIDPAKMNPNQPTVLYNAMLAPLVPYGIRGAIWYQGESNKGRAEQYRTLFPVMISDWRKQFGQGDFPFGFVQLAPFDYGGSDPRELAEQWESQALTLSLPNTGMAVTTDIGNVKDIHPRNKQEVGRRLALWALNSTYGKKEVVFSGPVYDSMEANGSKIRLKFKEVNGGLLAEGGKPLSHFQIAGDDQKFVPATAEIDGDTVVVSAAEVAKPVAVRFAWEDTAEPNFFNKAGLPASPFRTDTWPLITAGRK